MIKIPRAKVITICFSALFLLVILPGCGEKKEEPQSDEIKFEVQDSLLGKQITSDELQIDFHPPVNWEEIPDNYYKAIEKKLIEQHSIQADFTYQPEYIFTNSNTNSLLTVGTLNTDTTINKDELFQRYNTAITGRFDSSQIKPADYTKDGIKIRQYLIQKNDLVTFKLLFFNPASRLIQFDYVSLKGKYPVEIKAIESSIGSIKIKEQEDVL